MRKLLLLISAIAFLTSAIQAQPGTEIYLFELAVKKNAITITNPVNITNHPGYDNQPYFHPDQPLLYYVSADSSGRTDIYQYNYLTKETTPVTRTPEREYSPTVTPDKKFLSCIIQRDNGAQDLGKYPIRGNAPAEIIISNHVVGYHAWADENNIVLFTLPQPFTLHQVNIKNQHDSIVADSIGRSLHKIPGEDAVSFVQQLKDNIWMIRKVESKTSKVHDIVVSMPSKEHDMAWTHDDKIVMSNESRLFFFNTKGKGEWKEVTINGNIPAYTITRIAVNSKGDKIALVVNEN